MKHVSTFWALPALISVLTVVPLVQCQNRMTQADLDTAARFLEIQVALGTNHIMNQTHKVVFKLTNKGTQPILAKDGWKIKFSMRTADKLTKDLFVVHGFGIKAVEGCFFEMAKVPGSAKVFPGLKTGQAFKITIEKEGLSVFKGDIDPRFIISAQGLESKTIASTDDDSLGFIFLAAANRTADDFSSMTTFRRSIVGADTNDLGRLPRNMIVPRVKNITDMMPGDLIDFSDSPSVYLWADNKLSTGLKNYLKEKLQNTPGIGPQKLQVVNQAPTGPGHRFYVQLKQPTPGQTQSKDSYVLANARNSGPNRENFTHLTATSEDGIYNGMDTFASLHGLYSVIPAVTIQDDADTERRCLNLDVTKHFFGVATIKKLLDLLRMYKMNCLVLTLGSDDAFRIPLRDAADFNELVTYASQRCDDPNKCLPPVYGSGAKAEAPGSGYYTAAQFSEILAYAKRLNIEVVPKINVIGSLRSAKKASHKRYERLSATNPTEAERFHLMSAEPTINRASAPGDACYTDGILDPCNPATKSFINEVINSLTEMYQKSGSQLKTFHAGGDEFVNYFGAFPSCQSAGKTQNDAKMDLVAEVQGFMSQVGGKVQVNEEAVVDADTNMCLQPSASVPGFKPADLYAEFHKTAPTDPSTWNLNKAQMDYLTSEVQPFDPTVQGSVPDVLRTYNGTKAGVAPWATTYTCANSGYKVIFAPENFFDLSAAYELSFDELGNWKSHGFFVVNNFRLMMLEPFNIYINSDITSEGSDILPNRACQVKECPPLTRPENVVGMQATVDTRVIRNEEQLWYALLPRLLLIAQKMWFRSPFENLLKAEDPATLVNGPAEESRMAFRRIELMEFTNALGYKELERLDKLNYTYRIPPPEAHTRFGIPLGILPPFPLMARSETPGLEIEFKDLNNTNNPWTPLFKVDEMTGQVTGGYWFNFPDTKQEIMLRTKSADGLRTSPAFKYSGGTENFLPREVPPELRWGTCLPVQNPWVTDINEITEAQWKRIISNVIRARNEDIAFREQRVTNLTNAMNEFNTRYRQNNDINAILNAIVTNAQSGVNVSALPLSSPLRYIYDVDAAIHNARGQEVRQKLEDMHTTYLDCLAGKATVQPPDPAPVSQPVPNMGGQGTGQMMPGMMGQGQMGQGGMGPGQRGPGRAGQMGPGGMGQGQMGPGGMGQGQMGQGRMGHGQMGQGGMGQGQMGRGGMGRPGMGRGGVRG